MKWLILIVLSCGCAPYYTEVGHDITVGAMAEATSTASKKQLTELVVTATQGARDEALGQTTKEDIDNLVVSFGDSIRAQLNTLVTTELRTELRELVRVIVNELLGTNTMNKIGILREELVGAPFQRDIDAVIAAEVPKITAAIQTGIQIPLTPILNEADQEAAKWKPIAIGFAVGSGFLCLCLIFAYSIIRGHRQIITTLLKSNV
jgi:hypothetical protein